MKVVGENVLFCLCVNFVIDNVVELSFIFGIFFGVVLKMLSLIIMLEGKKSCWIVMCVKLSLKFLFWIVNSVLVELLFVKSGLMRLVEFKLNLFFVVKFE